MKETMDNFIPKNAAALCARCANHILGTLTCRAFPNGIPKEVLCGEHKHTTPYPGDNGIVFEPKERYPTAVSELK